jgi:hypothetical protein
MALQMHPLDNWVTTNPIQMGCEFPSNRSGIDDLGLLTTRTFNLAMIQF